jgi:hypothetical protein
MHYEIIIGAIAALLAAALVAGIYVGSAAWTYHMTYDYEVVVKDGDKVIYDGPAACVSYSSVGSATTVRIMKPFLYCSLFQAKELVSNNITVSTKGE